MANDDIREQLFAHKLMALHQDAQPAVPGSVHQQEVDAMFDAFLGEDYSALKRKSVHKAQALLHLRQAELAAKLSVGKLDPSRYVDEFNDALAQSFAECEEVLGADDFETLFGAAPKEMQGFIDKETFLRQQKGAEQSKVLHRLLAGNQLSALVPIGPDAERWINKSNAATKSVWVDPARPAIVRLRVRRKLFVSNLAHDVQAESLREAFGQFGTVIAARVVKDSVTGGSRCFGFVEMGSDVDAKAAINGMNGQSLEGRAMEVLGTSLFMPSQLTADRDGVAKGHRRLLKHAPKPFLLRRRKLPRGP